MFSLVHVEFAQHKFHHHPLHLILCDVTRTQRDPDLNRDQELDLDRERDIKCDLEPERDIEGVHDLWRNMALLVALTHNL